MSNIEEELQRLIAQATQETVERQQVETTGALLPWTEETANQFRPLIQTADGIKRLITDQYFLGLGDYVYPSVLDDIIELFEERKRRPVNLVLFLEGIGCVARNSLTPVPGRGLVSIGDLDPGVAIRESAEIKVPVCTRDSEAVAVRFFNSGHCVGKEIRTRGDFSLRSTCNHPLYTMTVEGPVWRKAEEVQVGDYVAIRSGTQCFGSSDLTPDEAYLLGFCTGDGHNQLRPRSEVTSWTCSKEDPNQFFYLWCLFKQHGKIKISREKRRNNFIARANFPLLRQAPEICCLTHNKTVPEVLLQADRDCQVAYLQGLFDSDGSVSKFGHPQLTSVSWALIHQVQLMLLNLGIVSLVNKRKTKWQNGSSYTWRLKAEADAHKFFELVGFRIERKQKRQLLARKQNNNLNVIPNVSQLMRRVNYGSPLFRTAEGNSAKFKYLLRGVSSPGKEVLGAFLRKYQDTTDREAFDILTQLTDPDILWVKVKSITDIEDDFVDLQVPDGSCFVSEGFVNHNSGKTTKFSILQFLQWFELSMHIDPQAEYNLIPGSQIALINLSRTEMQARRVAFGEVWRRFQCPFIRDYFTPNPRFSKEIQIPQNNTIIFAGTSSAMSALGYNLFGGGIDEACFLEVVEDSKKASIQDRYDAAEEIHNAIWDRMTSRFMVDGQVPGMLVMFSSPRYPEDFLERKIRQAVELGDESGVFFRRRSTWSAKGKAFYPSGEYFYVNVDSLDEMSEEDAVASGDLIFLDHDSLPPKFEAQVRAGKLEATLTDRGTRLIPREKVEKPLRSEKIDKALALRRFEKRLQRLRKIGHDG